MTADQSREKQVIEATLTRLVMANRILARENIIDNFGHVSVRHPLDPERYFLSRSRSPEIVTRDDIMEFTLEGEQIGKDPRKPYAERHIHGAIYRDRPDVAAVTHHHARAGASFHHVRCLAAADVPHGLGHRCRNSRLGQPGRFRRHQHAGRQHGHGPFARARPRPEPDGAAARARSHLRRRRPGSRRDDLDRIARQCRTDPVHAPDGDPSPISPTARSRRREPCCSAKCPLARAWDYWVARAGFGGL